MVTVFIQYSDGTSQEVQMTRQEASQLAFQKANGQLPPNIVEIELKLGGEGR